MKLYATFEWVFQVRELLLERDSNGPKMLSMMTEQFLSDPRLVLWKSQGATLADKCRQMWDQLGQLLLIYVSVPIANKKGYRSFTLLSRNKKKLFEQTAAVGEICWIRAVEPLCDVMVEVAASIQPLLP